MKILLFFMATIFCATLYGVNNRTDCTAKRMKPSCCECNRVWIRSLPGHIPLNIDVFSNMRASNSTSFTVAANTPCEIYDVWLSVSKRHLDTQHQLYIAHNGPYALPLRVSLIGGEVDANPAAIQTGSPHQARPRNGHQRDGSGIHINPTTQEDNYRIVLEQTDFSQLGYADFPSGNYSLTITVHVGED